MDTALLFIALSQTFALPPGLLSAVCYVESHHNPKAVHKDDGGQDSLGLCQIQPGTARILGFKGKSKELLDPNVNMFWAGLYLKHQLLRYDNDPRKAVAAYNSGTYQVNEKSQVKNRIYVHKVMTAWEEGR